MLCALLPVAPFTEVVRSSSGVRLLGVLEDACDVAVVDAVVLLFVRLLLSKDVEGSTLADEAAPL